MLCTMLNTIPGSFSIKYSHFRCYVVYFLPCIIFKLLVLGKALMEKVLEEQDVVSGAFYVSRG